MGDWRTDGPQVLAVAAGGACGSVLRFVVTGEVQRRFPAFLPAGTLAVNLAGCLPIGVLMAWVERGSLTGPLRLFLITGLLGGLTTFSTFGWETVELLRERDLRLAACNVLGNLGLGLPAAWLGGRIVATLASSLALDPRPSSLDPFVGHAPSYAERRPRRALKSRA